MHRCKFQFIGGDFIFWVKSPLTNVLLLPLNIFSTYYFQSLMKPGASFLVSVVRGLVLSGLLIYALPLLLGANAIWLAMPITEAAVAFLVVFLMYRYTRELSGGKALG